MIACCIFYNDAENLEKMFKSLRDADTSLREIDCIAIDGRFNEYPDDKIYSTDGSIDVAKKYASLYIPADRLFLQSQIDKRNRYLKEIPDNEYFLVIDSDEVLKGQPRGILNLDSYAVSIIEPANKRYTSMNRLHKKTPDLKYWIRHCYLFNESKINSKARYEMERAYCNWICKPREDREQFGFWYGQEKVKEALKGCITRRKVSNYLLQADSSPVEIWHHPEKRKPDWQMKDNVYLGNRIEIELNRFLPYQDSVLQLPYVDKFGGIEDDDIVVLEYTGESYNGAVLGRLKTGQRIETNYRYAKQLHMDFNPSLFKIVDKITNKE